MPRAEPPPAAERVTGAGEGQQQVGGGKRGTANTSGCCKRWELWLNVTPAGVKRGFGVAAGLRRKALTAPGGREEGGGEELGEPMRGGGGPSPRAQPCPWAANPNAERESGRWGQGKQITRPQPNGCYFWLGIGSFSNYAAKMFRRWHFICVGAVTWASARADP